MAVLHPDKEVSSSQESQRLLGIALGSAGMLCFSFTLPATKFAVEGIDPFLVAMGRTILAFPIASAYLLVAGGFIPPRTARRGVAIVVFGNVVGFPLSTAFSLAHGTSVNAAVILGAMPLAIAIAGSVRAKEQPGPVFWLCATGGALTVTAFSIFRSGIQAPRLGDLFAFLAVVTGSLGYAEGAILTRRHGAIKAISWSICCGLPVAVAVSVAAISLQDNGPALSGAGSHAWAGMIYIAAVSSFLGFIPWNLGLAKGGIARVGQIQLVQPILTLVWSAVLLDESVSVWAVAVSVLVLAIVVAASRARIAENGQGS
ncbi:DMT family transporter [Kitasatospora sp. NPDC057500]|uniref:DMT family transporter n=1 Tax=Kitasatospora sp. NPDC057500 TaxID=3346151 RepID=UPI0036A0A3C9